MTGKKTLRGGFIRQTVGITTEKSSFNQLMHNVPNLSDNFSNLKTNAAKFLKCI